MGPEIIVLDLNGTLLDLAVLDRHFARIFGSASYREKWFEQMQVLWMTTIATGTYQPFAKLAQAALEMLAAKEPVELSSADEKAVVSQMAELPAFAEVPEALGQLRAAGFRLVALTNGARNSAVAQLEHAGIADPFEAIFSTDDVERFKPAPEPYLHVAKRLDAKPGKLLLAAAHAWDVAGAHHAGLSSAFVAHPRQVLNPLATKPDYRWRISPNWSASSAETATVKAAQQAQPRCFHSPCLVELSWLKALIAAETESNTRSAPTNVTTPKRRNSSSTSSVWAKAIVNPWSRNVFRVAAKVNPPV